MESREVSLTDFCTICKLPISGVFIGDGNGRGQDFAHESCYYRREMEKSKAELASVKAELKIYQDEERKAVEGK